MKLSIQWVFTLFKQFSIQRLRIYLCQYVSLCVIQNKKENEYVQFKSFSNKVVRQETPYYTFFQLGATKFIFEFYPFSGNL